MIVTKQSLVRQPHGFDALPCCTALKLYYTEILYSKAGTALQPGGGWVRRFNYQRNLTCPVISNKNISYDSMQNTLFRRLLVDLLAVLLHILLEYYPVNYLSLSSILWLS